MVGNIVGAEVCMTCRWRQPDPNSRSCLRTEVRLACQPIRSCALVRDRRQPQAQYRWWIGDWWAFEHCYGAPADCRTACRAAVGGSGLRRRCCGMPGVRVSRRRETLCFSVTKQALR